MLAKREGKRPQREHARDYKNARGKPQPCLAKLATPTKNRGLTRLTKEPRSVDTVLVGHAELDPPKDTAPNDQELVRHEFG